MTGTAQPRAKMKISEILYKMSEILSYEGVWKPGALAWDDESWISTAKPCDPMSEDAKSWSVEGACIKASGGDKTAWASAKRHILAFSPKLGTDGREVTYDMVWNLLKGAYYH